MVLLAVFMFSMGIRLSHWAPANYGRVANVACVAIAPWLLGAVLVLALYAPLPKFLAGSVISGSFFWIFAVVGAAVSFRKVQQDWVIPSMAWSDAVILACAVTMVRILALGIPLVH